MSKLTAVILAAGAGSRLGELGKRYSKPMVPVLGRALIEWVFDRLTDAGIERTIVVGHPSDQPLHRFLSERHPDAQLVEQSERRGIADALRCALPFLADEAGYLACACDSIFRVDDLRRLIAAGAREQAAAVAVLDMGIAAAATRSSVRLEGDRAVEIVEKPAPGAAPSGLVAMPLYWLPRAFARCLTATAVGESFISTALTEFAQRGGTVFAVPVSERLEVTTPADIETVAQQLSRPDRRQ